MAPPPPPGRAGVSANRVGDLNERAGTKAKAASAYGAALAYLRQAIDMLPADAWSSQHEVAFRIHHDATELAFVAGYAEQAESLSEVALLHARSRLERADLYIGRVIGYTLQFDVARAARAGEEGLRLFGLELSGIDPDAAIAAAFARVEELLSGCAISDLSERPLTRDPEHIAQQKLLSELPTIFYQTDPKRFAMVMLWAVCACLEHGHTLWSPYIYGGLGNLLVLRGQYERGHAVGRMAVELARKLGALEGRTL